MLKNNAFSHDDDGERLERLRLLSANIDTYSVELDITGDKLLRSQNGGADWTASVTTAGVEDGEAQEATESLNQGLAAAHDYYVAAKEHLLSIIYDIEKPDEIIEEYGVKGDAPWNYGDLVLKFEKWLETHARLTAATDPRVVSAAVITNLTNHRDTINTLWHNSKIQHREKSQAYAAKYELFDKQSNLLTFAYGAAKLVWGDDEPKLKDLGFVPSSEIWTKGTPPAPKNLAYDDVTGTFSWTAVDGADSYEMDCRLTGASGDWTTLYQGAANSTTNKPSEVGEYDFRVRAIAGDDPGNWCTPITVEIEGGGLETPANLTAAYISTPTPSVKLNWDVVPLAEKYNVFRSVVPHGQPSGIFAIVASPTTNAYDDPSTTPGMTQYYYVTAVKGVEESDPSGVVSVDIA